MTVPEAIQILTDEAERLQATPDDETGVVRSLVRAHGLEFNAWFCVCCELADRDARRQGYASEVDRAHQAAAARVAITRAAAQESAHTREEPHTREPGAGDVAPAKAPAGRSKRKGEAGMSHTREMSRQATCYPKNQTIGKEISPSSIDNNFISS